jgi:hypothetical protein
MKTLSDNTLVVARTYHYLLDWNESNCKVYINEMFDKNRLCDLNIDEYKQLFEYATKNEFKTTDKN